MPPARENRPQESLKSVHWPFGRLNYIIFGVAIASILGGFLLLAKGSMTAAPLLLVLGFCVLVPLAIIVDGRKEPPTTP